MEKRKVFKISIIDKEISRTEFDRNTFYTSDSELTLVFKLIEKDYTYDHGEILLYNESDKSFVTRQITKKENDFFYEIDSDIIPHYGKWKAQLQLVNEGDVYTSKPFEFSIVNDLSNLAPKPTLTDINNWSTLKQSAVELIDEMNSVIDDIKKAEMIRQSQENSRVQSESKRQIQERLRIQGENQRQSQENKRIELENERRLKEIERNKNESNRQTIFENNEVRRKETFNDNEALRQENEAARKQAESERQSTFESNETERQTTFETAEQERQSAELIRVENESQRNLTSVDEFIKLQNAVGGRNYASENFSLYNTEGVYAYLKIAEMGENVTIKLVDKNPNIVLPKDTGIALTGNGVNTDDGVSWVNHNQREKTHNNLPFFSFYPKRADALKTIMERYYIKVEKSPIATPYTKAPEDYEVVSKDDYYKHIKMMNEFKDNQFNQLKQAVIALGGTI